jgi:hypothetical protein
MSDRIKWTQGKWSETGDVNGLNLFAVGRGTTRQEHMYYLGTDLPVRASTVLGQHYPTPTHAKVAAERLLSAFIDRLTTPRETDEMPEEHS